MSSVYIVCPLSTLTRTLYRVSSVCLHVSSVYTTVPTRTRYNVLVRDCRRYSSTTVNVVDIHRSLYKYATLTCVRHTQPLLWFPRALGLKWKEAGSEKPLTGAEIKSAALSAALQAKIDFTISEWEDFGVSDISYNSYVKAGDCYFKPDARTEGTSMTYNNLAKALKNISDHVQRSRSDLVQHRALLVQHRARLVQCRALLRTSEHQRSRAALARRLRIPAFIEYVYAFIECVLIRSSGICCNYAAIGATFTCYMTHNTLMVRHVTYECGAHLYVT